MTAVVQSSRLAVTYEYIIQYSGAIKKITLKVLHKYAPGIDWKQKQYGIIDMECMPALIGVVYGHITFKSARKLAE